MTTLLADLEPEIIIAGIIGIINLIVFWVMADNIGKLKKMMNDFHREKFPHLYEEPDKSDKSDKDDSEIKEYVKTIED